MCFSVAPSVMLSSLAIPMLVRPSAMAARTSRSAGRQGGQRVVGPLANHELGDDLRIEGGPAPGDAAQGIHEVRDVADPILQQVADAARAIGEELGRVLALHELAEYQDRAAWDPAPRLDSGPKPLVALAGGHPDVHHGHVRAMGHDGLHECRSIAHFRHDGAPGLFDEPGNPLADERRVLGDDDAER
jgi:hypothetical protein